MAGKFSFGVKSTPIFATDPAVTIDHKGTVWKGTVWVRGAGVLSIPVEDVAALLDESRRQ